MELVDDREVAEGSRPDKWRRVLQDRRCLERCRLLQFLYLVPMDVIAEADFGPEDEVATLGGIALVDRLTA